jgi:hypothetical protein
MTSRSVHLEAGVRATRDLRRSTALDETEQRAADSTSLQKPAARREEGVASTCKIAQLPMHESVRLGTGAEAALALQELGTWR